MFCMILKELVEILGLNSILFYWQFKQTILGWFIKDSEYD